MAETLLGDQRLEAVGADDEVRGGGLPVGEGQRGGAALVGDLLEAVPEPRLSSEPLTQPDMFAPQRAPEHASGPVPAAPQPQAESMPPPLGELPPPEHLAAPPPSVEPLPVDHPIRGLDNVVLTPHLGYYTEENYRQYFVDVVDNIGAWLDGRPLPRKIA